jgi:hypothetical protein
VSGDIVGTCGTLLAAGTESAERAEVRFRITVGATPSAVNLNVACTHDPIWPQGGEPVTINAAALNRNLAGKVADRIEIWVGGGTAPALASIDTPNEFHAVTASGPGTTMSYGCRLRATGTIGTRSPMPGPSSTASRAPRCATAHLAASASSAPTRPTRSPCVTRLVILRSASRTSTAVMAPISRLTPFPMSASGRLLDDPGRSPADCQLLDTDDGIVFTSDSPIDHLMGPDVGRVRGADLRQMEFVFAQCRKAGC